MTERPILFSGPMVRAILEGSKTMTRRVVKDSFKKNGFMDLEFDPLKCPYGLPGDLLWVRETFATVRSSHGNAQCFCYRADDPTSVLPVKYKPSIHMPRWASRITLEITGIKVERVQDISEEDAKAEGAPTPTLDLITHRDRFQVLWDFINAKRGFGWSQNPWVWAISFKVVK